MFESRCAACREVRWLLREGGVCGGCSVGGEGKRCAWCGVVPAERMGRHNASGFLPGRREQVLFHFCKAECRADAIRANPEIAPLGSPPG